MQMYICIAMYIICRDMYIHAWMCVFIHIYYVYTRSNLYPDFQEPSYL